MKLGYGWICGMALLGIAFYINISSKDINLKDVFMIIAVSGSFICLTLNDIGNRLDK